MPTLLLPVANPTVSTESCILAVTKEAGDDICLSLPPLSKGSAVCSLRGPN